ncbi:flagellar motor switch protein FliG [Candidatus Peregrinibacteria bacterium]|nr:flagellar motor switch protein FliG [Candidatus Peregrinibacteria bacterium]
MAEAGKALDIVGARKAAIFLVSIDQDSAARIFQQLEKESREMVEKLTMEIAKLDTEPVSREERDSVMEEFYHISIAQQYVEQGGIGYARSLLEKVFSPDESRRLLETVEQSIKMAPFSFLQKTDTETLITAVQDEHPQTIALILAHLPHTQAAEILEALPLQKQRDVILRLSTMEQTSPEVVSQIEKVLESKLAIYLGTEYKEADGIAIASEILNLTKRSTERGILEGLEEQDPELVDQIRKLMFTFDDIMRVNDRGMQNLLKQIEPSTIALGLKKAPEELKDKFFRNMSKRAADNIKEEMEFMGPTRVSDIEKAQQSVVDMVRRLEEQGELIVEGRAGAEEIVV